MIFYNDITMTGGRLRGLSAAVNTDEPVRKAEAYVGGYKRIGIIDSASGPILCDWSLYDEIRIITIDAIDLTFSGANDGQGCILTLKGGNLATLPIDVRFNSIVEGYDPTSGSSAIDKLGFSFDLADSKYDLVSVITDIG